LRKGAWLSTSRVFMTADALSSLALSSTNIRKQVQRPLFSSNIFIVDASYNKNFT